MAVLRRDASDRRTNFDAEAIARLTERQQGVISREQLASAGVGNATIDRWLARARLHRVHPHVYALGHAALSLGGRLFAALLYAGDKAVFSHTTAAWIWSLVDVEPTRIHLTAPGRRGSRAVRLALHSHCLSSHGHRASSRSDSWSHASPRGYLFPRSTPESAG